MEKLTAYIKIVIVVLVAFILNACDNMTEEITLNEDGSGTYEVYTDMVAGLKSSSALMSMMGSAMQEADSTFAGDEAAVDFKKELEDKFWKDFGDEPVDSLMNFLQMMKNENNGTLPDSIKNDPAKLALFENMNIHVWGSRDKDILNTGMLFNFKNLNEIDDMFDAMEQNKSSQGAMGMNPMAMSGLDGMNPETDYKFGKKVFSRKTTMNIAKEMNEEDMAFMKMMFPNAKSRTIVHLPKKAKKIKGDHMVSKDGKTVIFEYDLMDMMTGKANTDFEIKMK